MSQDKGPLYQVLTSDRYGRYAVTSQQIAAGEIIIDEVPVAYGPKADSVPVCLGCHTPVSCRVVCTSCSWPVCDVECELKKVHSENECVIFSAVKAKFAPVIDISESCHQYECITPLRVLLAKERDPERWDREVRDMEAHTEERKKNDIWRVEQINIVEYLHQICKLKDRFSEELIHFVCGILEVNAFSAHTRIGYDVRCLYPQTGILSHCCVPNVRHCIHSDHGTQDDFRVFVRSAVKMDKGQEILISYTHTLAPTLFRRAHLKEGKYFDCGCARCADPTELGTHLSSLKCAKCEPGYVLSTDSLEATAPWKCNHCEFTTKGESVLRVFRIIQKEIDDLDYNEEVDPVASREGLIKKYQGVLHHNHAFLTTLKYSLSQLYGRAEGYQFEDLPNILLERKIEICKDILKIADIIKPGYSRQRGWNLYELHAPFMLLAKNQFQFGEIDERTLRTKLEEAAKYLEEAALILSLEDPESVEGVTGGVAQESLRQLRDSIDILPR